MKREPSGSVATSAGVGTIAAGDSSVEVDPTGYIAGEKTYIRHTSHEFGPAGNYAINGSTWECLVNGSLMRKDGNWKVVEWTYA